MSLGPVSKIVLGKVEASWDDHWRRLGMSLLCTAEDVDGGSGRELLSISSWDGCWVNSGSVTDCWFKCHRSVSDNSFGSFTLQNCIICMDLSFELPEFAHTTFFVWFTVGVTLPVSPHPGQSSQLHCKYHRSVLHWHPKQISKKICNIRLLCEHDSVFPSLFLALGITDVIVHPEDVWALELFEWAVCTIYYSVASSWSGGSSRWQIWQLVSPQGNPSYHLQNWLPWPIPCSITILLCIHPVERLCLDISSESIDPRWTHTYTLII